MQGRAVAALVAALFSLVLGPVVAIVALLLAGGAKRRIRSSGGLRSGLGLVGAARSIAVLAMLLWVAVGLAVGYLIDANAQGKCVEILAFQNAYC